MKEKDPLELSKLAKSIVINGIYEHYKGNRYKVIAIAHHSEILEELVVYEALYGEGGVWVRPLNMFLEDVSVGGRAQQRFRLT